jgi:hypothetical protein
MRPRDAYTHQEGQVAGYIGAGTESPARSARYTLPGGLVERGEYTDRTAYDEGDIVTHQGRRYVATTAVPDTNTTPPDGGGAWDLVDNKQTQHYRAW